MTIDHDPGPTAPVGAGLRPAAPPRASTRCASPAASGRARQSVNGGRDAAAHRAPARVRGLARELRPAAAGTLPDGRRGREFSDSEIYKYLEALAWEIGRTATPPSRRRFRAMVARIAAAQEPDGYLNTMFGRAGQEPRWSDLEWGHELYCLGHLFQAAVARDRTRPGADDGLIDDRAAGRRPGVRRSSATAASRRSAATPRSRSGSPNSARATRRAAVHAQAQLFVERHGTRTLADIEYGRSYFQDDVPVRDATVLRGHAVRANYLAAGAADVAVDTGDDGAARRPARGSGTTRSPGARTSRAVRARTTRTRRSATTGSCPPDRAYSETCASIGSIMFAWRLLLADGDAAVRRPDRAHALQRRGHLAGDDGRSFYYANTLHQRVPGIPADPDEHVACARRRRCAPRGSRCRAARPTWRAPSRASTPTSRPSTTRGVQLHQYAPAEMRTTLADGRHVAFDVDDGAIPTTEWSA